MLGFGSHYTCPFSPFGKGCGDAFRAFFVSSAGGVAYTACMRESSYVGPPPLRTAGSPTNIIYRDFLTNHRSLESAKRLDWLSSLES